MRARRRLAETGRWRNSTRRWKPLSSLSDSYKTITFSFSSCYKNSYFFSSYFAASSPPVSSPAEPCRGAGLNPAPGGTTPQIPDLRSGHAAAVWMVRRPVLSQHFGFISFSFLQILLCFRHVRGRNGRHGFKSHRRYQKLPLCCAQTVRQPDAKGATLGWEAQTHRRQPQPLLLRQW